MKFLLIALMISGSVLADTKPVKTVKKTTVKTHTKTTKPVHPALKKEEDCDDKAKKPVEITPESISLSGNTGCSLDTPSH